MTQTKLPAAKTNDPAANPDPITKAPGAHPVGAGIGAAAGGAVGVGGAIAAGAAMGSLVGPIGTAVGAVVGGVAGGLVGKGIAEHVNPSVEHDYWRSNYASRPYAAAGSKYEEYGPAYQYGWESRARHSDESFDDVEGALGNDWDAAKGKSTLNWDQAKPATRDAWDRIGADHQPE
jgi:phage tail tape-measure protein